MVRATSLLRNLHNSPLFTASKVPLSVNLGLSYAGKDSPPFVPSTYQPTQAGFQPPTKIGQWVRQSLDLRAGRGELEATEEDVDDGEGARELGILRRQEALRDARVKWGAGEDFFALSSGTGHLTHLAVSDGVGGWSPQFDPSLFSQSLMYHYHRAVTRNPSLPPSQALQVAYDQTQLEQGVVAGSATSCSLKVDLGRGKGWAANLGDSGYSILRDNKIIYESKPQIHYFNCPRQLAKVPRELQKEGAISDLPEHADLTEFDVVPGDILLLYTDGLSDNLPTPHIPLLSQHIHDLLHKAPQNAQLTPAEKLSEQARILADVLVAYGRFGMARTGKEEGWKTPFEEEARRHGMRFEGGKVDDITVITAVISEST